MAAKTLKCDVCDEKKGPKTRKPATLPSMKDVGAQAHIDSLVVEDAFKRSFYVVHVTDKVSRSVGSLGSKQEFGRSDKVCVNYVVTAAGCTSNLGGGSGPRIHQQRI